MRRILLCLLFCLGPGLSQAATPINLGPYLDYAVDGSRQWNVDDARRNGDAFLPHGEGRLNMGFVPGVLWIRLNVGDRLLTTDTNQFITLSKIHFRKIDFYQFNDNLLVQHQSTGTDLPYNSRSLAIPQWAFKLKPLDGLNQVFIRLETNSPVQSRIQLAPIEVLIEQAVRHEFYSGIILGLFGLMALLAGILLLSTRKLTLVYGMLLVSGALVVSLSHSGLGFQSIWPNLPELNPFLHRYTVAFTLGMAGLYTIEFLGIKDITPRLEMCTRLAAIFLMSVMLFPIFKVAPMIGILAYTLIPVLTLVCAWQARARQISNANTLMVGFTFFLVSIVGSSAASMGWLPEEYNYDYLLDLGMVVMVLIMAHGLAVQLTNQSLASAVTGQSIKAKSLFFASMSHELRTPINGILGMLTLLSKQKLNTTQQQLTEHAKSSAELLLKIVNDILDFSKIEGGKLDLEPIAFNVIELLEELIETFAYQEKAGQVELILDTHGITQPNIIADPGRLRQILNNLISNATKFTIAGQIEVKAQLSGVGPKQELIVSVKDTGIGISAEQLPRLFDLFTQADQSTTRKYGGTGLGLSIAKQLCELHGGSISATSRPGVGSMFSFSIAVQVESSQPTQNLPDLSGQTALIYDPNRAAAKSIMTYLRSWGCKARFASSKRQLLEKLQHSYFDIVICADDLDEVSSIYQPGKLLVGGVTGLPQARLFCKPVTASRLCNALTKTAEPVIVTTPVSTQTTEANMNAQPLSHYRLLLVEDNFINTEVARGILEDYGYDNVDLAENGQEALERLRSEHYDLVLMDCQMPLVDGYEATQLIRAGEAGDLSTLPIIAMTANAMQGDREKCLAVGMNDYIAKPIDPDKLERTLNNWLPS